MEQVKTEGSREISFPEDDDHWLKEWTEKEDIKEERDEVTDATSSIRFKTENDCGENEDLSVAKNEISHGNREVGSGARQEEKEKGEDILKKGLSWKKGKEIVDLMKEKLCTDAQVIQYFSNQCNYHILGWGDNF